MIFRATADLWRKILLRWRETASGGNHPLATRVSGVAWRRRISAATLAREPQSSDGPTSCGSAHRPRRRGRARPARGRSRTRLLSRPALLDGLPTGFRGLCRSPGRGTWTRARPRGLALKSRGELLVEGEQQQQSFRVFGASALCERARSGDPPQPQSRTFAVAAFTAALFGSQPWGVALLP